MDFEIVEQWQHNQDVELFYNNSQRKLTFKKYHFLYSKGVDDLVSYPYYDIEGFGTRFCSANISHDETLLAFQRTPGELEILEVGTLKLLFQLSIGKRSILGYQWLEPSTPHCNFFVVTSSAVEFYKYADGKLTNVRSPSMSVGHFWYEPQEGILVAAYSPPKLGQLQCFFLKQDKGPKYFSGPSFNIDVSPSVTDKWTASPQLVSNLTDFRVSEPVPHIAGLFKIYGNVYFAHLDAFRGAMKLYKIDEKVQQMPYIIMVPAGQAALRVVDNMLLVENYDLQETHIFDIHSEVYAAKPIAALWNGMGSETPAMKVKLKVFIDKPRIAVSTTFLYDGKPIQSSQKLPNYTGNGAIHTLDCALRLSRDLVFTDSDVCVDTKHGRCYRVVVKPEELVRSHPNRVEAILFLLRRTGYKWMALELLCESIKIGTSLTELSGLFFTMSEAYKIAALERRNERPNASPNRGTESKPLDNELKIESGLTVLLQTDMNSNVFQRLYDLEDMNLEYLMCVLLEYYRSLVTNDIQVHLSLQLLTAKIMIKTRNFVRLHQMTQYNIFTDSNELASVMLALAPTNGPISYLPGFQLGIDMLHRIDAHEMINQQFLENKFVVEAVQALSVHKLPDFDIKKLLLLTEEMEDPLLYSHITQFIRENPLV